MFGTDPLEKATVEMWNRRAELAFYLPIEYAGGFMGQDVAVRARRRVGRMLETFDAELATRQFIAGERFSVADITTKVAIDFGTRFNDIAVPENLANFRRWRRAMDARPSSSA